MSAQELLHLLQDSALSAYADALLKHIRPAALLMRNEGHVEPAKSRFNNAPDLPPDFEWPEH